MERNDVSKSIETDRFAGMIGPGNLLGLVENAAPWLLHGAAPVSGRPIELGEGPAGWRDVLMAARSWKLDGDLTDPGEEDVLDYFAVCLAAHHATVATFVPTDVDSKIRGLLWRGRSVVAMRRMVAFVECALKWDVDAVSARVVHVPGHGPVSGHDGERLSVLCGALGAIVHAGDTTLAAKVEMRIEGELAREAAAFRACARTAGAELDTARIASVLTHNVGDVDQGISFWSKAPAYAPYRARFARLAHENTKPFGGAFARAAAVYRDTLSPEGHRNYPLRGPKGLRRARELLLPIAPFLDEWGAAVAKHPLLETEDRAEVLAGLVSGCLKLETQFGYYRAIAGMMGALGNKLDQVSARIPAALRRELDGKEMRRQVAIARVSFESSYRKKTAALVAGWR
jgi:hypothetical protein